MQSISPLFYQSFKLSLLSFAILSVQYSFAENLIENESQTLSTIQLQAQSENTNESSEKTKAYTVKNSSSASKLNIAVKETPSNRQCSHTPAN